MSKKVILNIVILFLLVGGVVVGVFAIQQATNYLASAQTSIGSPSNVVTRLIGSDQVVISWNTNDEVLALVLYGDSPTALVNTQTELSAVKTHRVTIGGLKENTSYFFKIQVGQEIYDNNGKSWRFETPASVAPAELTEKDFRDAYGTSNAKFDLNKDGVVNGFDYRLYLKQM